RTNYSCNYYGSDSWKLNELVAPREQSSTAVNSLVGYTPTKNIATVMFSMFTTFIDKSFTGRPGLHSAVGEVYEAFITWDVR
ncbi:hypothetical protein J6590_081999, partial [Homalodisca vitripennis]